MSYLDKDNNVNVWEMEYKVSDYHYNVASEILPYDNSLYFVYDGTLYRCMYKNITAQSVSIENGINWFSTDKEEVVFDEAEIRKFGIYADTIVMFGGDNSIWTLDISSGKAVCVLEEPNIGINAAVLQMGIFTIISLTIVGTKRDHLMIMEKQII